jgi:PAS domain S-box-containing protein
MNDAVYLLDNECRIVRCNTALEKLLGKPSNEIIGHLCWEVVHCTPGPIEECPMLRMKQTLQRETTLRSVGNEHLELIADPVMDKDGSLVGAVHIIADISQRKQAEEERQQMEQKAQLASRLASVGELAAGIAHEINNPLTSVIGYAQLLSAEESIPADMKKDLKAIIDGANRVAGIVKRLLTFARQTKPQQTLVNVADLITATLELRAYHLRNNNIKVTTQFDPKLPIITADAGQLQQVFLNIIVNAETEVKRSRGKGKLLIKTEKIGKRIRVSFEDNGPGIDKENLKKIFDPFFTTKEVGEGTGLGLSICYGIIAEHNGRIWAESEPGKGATFIVELPIVTKSSQVKQAKPPEEKTQKVAKAKILAVDDEPMILQLVSRILAEEGYQVETADSAASALKMIDTGRYSLILLDIKMPDMDGIQLYKRLQKMAPSLAKRVMFITGDVMGPETEAFLSWTKAPYATKPFDAEQLKREIKRLLARGQ